MWMSRASDAVLRASPKLVPFRVSAASGNTARPMALALLLAACLIDAQVAGSSWTDFGVFLLNQVRQLLFQDVCVEMEGIEERDGSLCLSDVALRFGRSTLERQIMAVKPLLQF